jgi:hypothetical protein
MSWYSVRRSRPGYADYRTSDIRTGLLFDNARPRPVWLTADGQAQVFCGQSLVPVTAVSAPPRLQELLNFWVSTRGSKCFDAWSERIEVHQSSHACGADSRHALCDRIAHACEAQSLGPAERGERFGESPHTVIRG